MRMLPVSTGQQYNGKEKTMSKTFDPSAFTVKKARPIPVILLLDTSGSMMGGKIGELNQAVNDMIASFKAMKQMETEVDVAIITFGGEVKMQLPLTEVSQIAVDTPLTACGNTPMGAALSMAKAMIEDKGIIPSNGLRPMVVLASDGQPNDEWQGPLDAFVNDGRTRKCNRMAMAIGDDADESILSMFLSAENKLFRAKEAGEIYKFFQQVTMSVTTQSQSVQQAGQPVNTQPPVLPLAGPQSPAPSEQKSRPHYEW